MSEQATEWIDADERKPEDGQRIAIIVRGVYMDSVHGVGTYANGTVSPEGRPPSKWSAVKWWLPLPPEPDPPDERKAALEDVFGGEWERDSEYLYDCDSARVEFYGESATLYCSNAKVRFWQADGLREALESARHELAETRDQLDDLLGPYEYDPDTVVHPSEHLREWVETSRGGFNDGAAEVFWVLAGNDVDEPTANGLERETGIDKSFWLNLQRKYDEVHGG